MGPLGGNHYPHSIIYGLILTKLLVFIDESGNPVQTPPEKVFSCGAVWCIAVSGSGVMESLRFTIDELRRAAQKRGQLTDMPREISFRHVQDMADELVELASSKSLDDRSVLNKGHPWTGTPVSFTTARANPSSERALLPKVSNSEFGNQTRLKCVADLLRPLSVCEEREPIEVVIVFDSEVWASSIDKYDPGLRTTIPNPSFSVSVRYEKSTSIPGLQIADLVAGINRQHLLNQSHSKGFRHIQERTLYQIRRKALPLDSY